MAHTHDHHTHDHHAFDDPALADMLDLDAAVSAGHLDEIAGWVAGHAPADTRTVVDLGAGTGTGSAALARWFPEAAVVAVDGSATMLDRLRANPRLTPVHADLDAGWPDVGTPDVVWAASSLHHLSDVPRVLRDAHAAIRPGGVLAAVELDDQPRVLDDDAGRALEDRAHAAAAQAGWNHHPDWSPALERAGFTVVERRRFALDADPDPALAARYARMHLTRLRAGLAERLSGADRETLDRLLADGGPRHPRIRAARTVWLARRQVTS